jgi:serine/threonine protein kinase
MAHTDPERDQLEMLASDFLAKLRRGDAPEIEDYAEAHPELAQDIRELFPTVRTAEQTKLRHPQRLRVEPGANGSADSTVALSLAPRELPVGGQGGFGESGSPYPGMALGKYTLQERIGRGSLGSVWRSQHPEFGIPVAIKVLHANAVDGDEEEDQRFLREARSAALLNHPHIMRVYDAGVDVGLRYLVMEYIEGGTVAELQAQLGGKLPVDQTVGIALGIAQAVEAAAEAGIVHRDIKPENILLDANGWPKLADLGLAKQIADGGESSVTRPGQSLGTPLYIAPEQAMGNAVVDVRTDIYSLGATLYHLLTGEPPFDGVTAYDIVHSHLHKALVDPRERNPDVPRQLSKIICRMLAKKPEDRYQSPTDLRTDLARMAGNAEDAAELTGTRHPWLFRGRGLATLGALVAVVAVALVLLYNQLTEGQNTTGTSLADKGAGNKSNPGELGSPAAGALRWSDWQVVTGIFGTPGYHPSPITTTEFSMQDGVLRSAGNKGAALRSLIYGTAHIVGPFSLRLEAMNVNGVGIAGTPEDGERCQITLRNPAEATGMSETWQTIVLQRSRGTLTCTVDSRRVYAITGDPLAAGRFWLSVPGNSRIAVRSFELSVEDSPGLPPRGQMQPRRRPPR